MLYELYSFVSYELQPDIIVAQGIYHCYNLLNYKGILWNEEISNQCKTTFYKVHFKS